MKAVWITSVGAHAILLGGIAVCVATAPSVAPRREPAIAEVKLAAPPTFTREQVTAPKTFPSRSLPAHIEPLAQTIPTQTSTAPQPLPALTTTPVMTSSAASLQTAFARTETLAAPGKLAADAPHPAETSAPNTENAAPTLPYLISSPPPAYPPEAKKHGWTGRVRVRMLVSAQGTVDQTTLADSSGHTILDDAALHDLQRWLFHPASKDGHPVPVWVTVPVVFKLG